MKRKICTMMLAITMAISGTPVVAWADEADNADMNVEVLGEPEAVDEDSAVIVESGQCGNNVTYTLDAAGMLVISGSGGMWDYSFDRQSPFQNRPIKKVMIETGITCIGSDAFFGCKELESVMIQEGVLSIGYAAFSGCSGLTAIEIPEGVTRIRDQAFLGCSGLTDISLPDSVTSIGIAAFSGCNSLTGVLVPKGVTDLSDLAFSNCENLLEIDVVEGNETYCSIDGVLFDKGGERIVQYPGGKMGTYRIPEGVAIIGKYAFDGSGGLTGVTIPKGVTHIESLEPVPIGVGSGVFSDCSRLTAINVAEDNANFCSVDGILFDKAKEQLLSYPGRESELMKFQKE